MNPSCRLSRFVLKGTNLTSQVLKPTRTIARTMGGYFSTQSSETKFVQDAINSDCVVIFSKTTCSYCRLAKSVFEGIGAPYTAVELNHKDNGPEIQSVLQDLTGGSTVPRVFINGSFVGGGTEVRNLQKENKLLPLLAKCSPGVKYTEASASSKL